MFTKEQFDKTNNNKNEVFSYNELMKNYSQDKKSLEIIIDKFKHFDLELAMIIENKKYVDAIILFNKENK